MKKHFFGIFLAAVLFAGMTHIAAAADIRMTRWNATTTTFIAELSGTASDVAVTVGGEAATVETADTGGKTSITASLSTKLELDTWYMAEITAGGETVCVKEFQLKKLFADNFDSYESNAAISAIYKGTNTSTVADAVDGKMRVRNVYDEGTVYHKDFETVQKDWRDYTLDVDYIPGGEGSNTPADQVFIYMESHPADISAANMKFENLRKASTAAENIMAGFVQVFLGKGTGYDFVNLTNVTNNATVAQNVQIGTKDGHAVILADKVGGGKVVQDFEIPTGAPRGGGFTFAVRNKHYYLDNLKVYQAVEKTGVLGYAQNVAFADENDGTTVSGTLEVLNKTAAAKPVTVIAALYNAENRMTALKVLQGFGTIAADGSAAKTFSVSAAGTDTNRLCLYLLDDLTSLSLYGEPITELK